MFQSINSNEIEILIKSVLLSSEPDFQKKLLNNYTCLKLFFEHLLWFRTKSAVYQRHDLCGASNPYLLVLSFLKTERSFERFNFSEKRSLFL